ncbi:MAG: hypothetical protein EOO24_46110 [Comamonadaceae bacterium]|nr:MAG: hypothetical protein EOO24_46110 [Comamonadaceae bacterium]
MSPSPTLAAPLQRWRPNVTVAALIERDGRYLLVEEHTDRGLKLNTPAGHLDAGESPAGVLSFRPRSVCSSTSR